MSKGVRGVVIALWIGSILLGGARARAQYANPYYRGPNPGQTPVPSGAPVAPRASAPVRVAARPTPTPDAHPIEWSFHGKIFTDQYWFTQGPDAGTLLQSNLSIWPEATAKFNEQWSAKTVLAANLFFASLTDPNQVTSRFEVREGFLAYQKSGLEVKAGQLIIPWGKSDGINPTDYFTAKDYTFYTSDDELRRRGELSLSVSFTPKNGDSPWNLQAVFQARYPQTKLIIPDLTLPPGVFFDKYPRAARYFHPEDIQGGARVQYLGNDFDFSVSAFRGTSSYPLYQFNPSNSHIEAYNPQMTAVGGDASFNLGASSVVRVETALLMPDNGTDTDLYYGLVEPWHWDTVAGIERAFGESWRIQVQGFLRYHLYYRDPSEFSSGNPITTSLQQAIGRANALLLNFPSQTVPGMTVRIAFANPASSWTADVFLVGYLDKTSGFLLRPSVGYKPIDDLKLQTGAEWYGGDPTQTLGALRDRSAIFAEAKYFY